MKRLLLWAGGFAVLFGINVLVELVFLPLLGLDNSVKNDVYFQTWWIVVAIWLFFGNEILKRFEGAKSLPAEIQNHTSA